MLERARGGQASDNVSTDALLADLRQQLAAGSVASGPVIDRTASGLPPAADEQGDWGILFRAKPGLLRSGNDPLRMFRRSEEHTSELQSLMRISYAGFCLKKTTE